MANRGFLAHSDETLAKEGTSGMFYLPTPDPHDVLFGCSYVLPSLWGSLFTREDILYLQADVEEPLVYPSLCAPTEKALALGMSRLQSVEGRVPQYQEVFAKWRARLGRVRKNYFLFETIELWHMGAEFGDELERLLDVWASPASYERIAVLKKAGLGAEPETALIGYDWLD